jgi:enoyl-[acyl-carrier protein] reductase II
MQTRITDLFKIKHPIIQAGMVWCSGWKLASAVSNAGGLGLIGSGSMYPEILEDHIRKCKEATNKPFGVNVPLIYPHREEIFNILIREKIKIIFTSAGNPAIWTSRLKDQGITVVHVIANVRSAIKCEESGVDAIVAEGFEAGGHDGKEETTTLTLVPLIRKAVNLPLIAAGGIATWSRRSADRHRICGCGRVIRSSCLQAADPRRQGRRYRLVDEKGGSREVVEEQIFG